MSEAGGRGQIEEAITVHETVDMTPAEKRTERAARKRQENEQKKAEVKAKWRGRWEKVIRVKDAVVGAAKNVPETAERAYDFVKDIPAKVDVGLARLDDYVDKKTDAWADGLDDTIQWTEDKVGGNGEHFSKQIKDAKLALKNAKRDAKKAIGRIGEDEYNRSEHAKATAKLEVAEATVKALEASRRKLADEGAKAKQRAPLTRGLAQTLRKLRGV